MLLADGSRFDASQSSISLDACWVLVRASGLKTRPSTGLCMWDRVGSTGDACCTSTGCDGSVAVRTSQS